jgi:hypothetical protein
VASDGLRSTRKGTERDGLVVGIEQAIKLRPAGFHTLGEGRFREPLILHEGIELTCDHALDGAGSDFFVEPLALQEFVERRIRCGLSTSRYVLSSLRREKASGSCFLPG